MPEWLWRSVPDEDALAALPADRRFGGETSARDVFHRMAGAWTYWGWKGGYFDSEADALTFYDEHCFMLAAQMAAPTRRSGSTPACTGPMASTGRARATGTSTTATARLIRPSRPTSGPSRTPASSRACPTSW
jgi:ribonucleotide reductase alpha subunit